jgi:hypothetical protein
MYSIKKTWEAFCNEIKYKARFFNQQAKRILDEIFSDLDSLETGDHKSVIQSGGPKTKYPQIYRARVSQSREYLDSILKDPIKELAAPPSESSKRGRMNSEGISVFYGAKNVRTCISEVRPPVGSHVVIGKFKIIRKIRLLDLNLLSQIYVNCGYFDPRFSDYKWQAAFLQHLVSELTKPIMPDEENYEYLPTQVVSEYLAEYVKPEIDGIIFKSSQIEAQGQNIILFYNSFRIEPYVLPSGSFVSIMHGSMYDPDNDDIEIIEETPYQGKKLDTDNGLDFLYKNDFRECTLRIDPAKDIEVIKIIGTNYTKQKIYTSRSNHIRSIE